MSEPTVHPALAAAVDAARAAGEIALGYYRGGFDVDAEARPDARHPGRPGGGARDHGDPRPALPRPRRSSARSSARRGPGSALDHRPHRRHQELRAAHPDVGGADRARGGGRGHDGGRVQSRYGRSPHRAPGRGCLCRRRAHPRVGLRPARRRAWCCIRVCASCATSALERFRAARGRRGAHPRLWRLLRLRPRRRRPRRDVLEADLKLWDIAAVKVLVEEAGGRLTDFAGRSTDPGRHVLASNGRLHDEAVALLAQGAGRAHPPDAEARVRLNPFRALRPPARARRARGVPPYDVVTRREARRAGRGATR